MKRKLLTGAALGFAALVVLIFVAPTYRQGEPSVAGSAAREFTFMLDGRPAKLSDLHGQVVVLNFWATWCPPCVEEMPSLNRLHSRIAARGGMVLGISVDDDAAAYQQFLQNQQIRFPTYRDPSKKISSQYGTYMFPETFLIGRDGRIARKIIGPQKWDGPELAAYIETMIARQK